MFAFRSAIRRLFGISIPNVDELSDSDILINELRSSLEEAEDERTEYFIDSIIAEAQADAYRDGIVDAIATLMTTLGVTKISIVDEDEDEDFPNNVVDSY